MIRVTSPRINEAITYWNAGDTLEEAGEKMGIGPMTVKSYLTTAGIAVSIKPPPPKALIWEEWDSVRKETLLILQRCGYV